MSSNPNEKEFILSLNCLPSKRIIWVGSGQNEEDSGVDRELSRKVVLALAVLDTQSQENIKVIVNCSGGEEIDGFAIHDAIAMCRSHVTVIVCGEASSAASVFIQAADKRLMTTNSYMMIHDGTYDLLSENAADAEVRTKIYRKWTQHYRKLLNAKAQIKARQFDTMMRKDTWLTPNEALALGLVDGIIEQWGDAL